MAKITVQPASTNAATCAVNARSPLLMVWVSAREKPRRSAANSRPRKESLPYLSFTYAAQYTSEGLISPEWLTYQSARLMASYS